MQPVEARVETVDLRQVSSLRLRQPRDGATASRDFVPAREGSIWSCFRILSYFSPANSRQNHGRPGSSHCTFLGHSAPSSPAQSCKTQLNCCAPTLLVAASRHQYAGCKCSIPLGVFDRNQGEKVRTQLDLTRNESLRDAAQAGELSDVDSGYVGRKVVQ